MKNKSLLSLVVFILSIMTPAVADSEFDKQFAQAQEKFNQIQSNVNQQKLTTSDESSPVLQNDVQSAKISDNDGLVTTLPTPKLPTLPKIKSGVNINAFPSPCAAAYLLAMGGSPVNNSNCNACTIAGAGSSNKIGSVLDSSVNAVVIDANDGVVTPIEWNSLSDLQRQIIIKQNPSIQLAVGTASKQKDMLSNCFGDATSATDDQASALNYFNK